MWNTIPNCTWTELLKQIDTYIPPDEGNYIKIGSGTYDNDCDCGVINYTVVSCNKDDYYTSIKLDDEVYRTIMNHGNNVFSINYLSKIYALME